MLRSTPFAWGLALVLALIAGMQALGEFPRQSGVDIYQFWGVPRARAVSGESHSPYVDGAGYARTLNALADSSSSLAFRRANERRRVLEPMGTPFLYAAYSAFPRDFDATLALYTFVLYAAAVGSVFALARMRGVKAPYAACAALAVVLTFRPFFFDVAVGNVNSLQLAILTAVTWLALRAAARPAKPLDALYLGILAPFVAFKPNTPWIAAAMALQQGTALGSRRLALGLLSGAILGAAALAIGIAYFGDAAVWGEWLRLVRGLDGSGLRLTLDQGNLSIPMWLADHRVLGLGVVGWGLALGALLLAAVAAALVAGAGPASAAAGRAIAADPWFAMSLGVLLTFLSSPLVWPHYGVLALLPMAWLLLRSVAGRLGIACACAAYAASSTLFVDSLLRAGQGSLARAAMVLAWTALIPGLIGYVFDRARRARPQAASTYNRRLVEREEWR